MGRRLNAHTVVHVAGGEGFKVYGPDDDVPAEHAKLIGDHLWDDGDTGGDAPTVPPRGGPGSGQEAWLAYARTFDDVDVADDASRDDIIAALDQAGHPTAAE